jgi:DNA ligase (NAD+)
MIDSINKSRNVKLANFIYAMGIPDIGFSRAKLICNKYNNDLEVLRNLKEEDLANIDGIGDVIAKEWVDTFKNEDFLRELDNVVKELTFTDIANTEEQILKDKTFVITGSLNHFENRDKLIEYIESLGGKASSSVSSKTSYLINNDVTSTSGKNKKAQELNIPIISEEDFLKLVGE